MVHDENRRSSAVELPAGKRSLQRTMAVAILSVAMLAAGAINYVSRRADTYRNLETSLARMERGAQELNALEWETLHKGRLEAEAEERLKGARLGIQEEFGLLNQVEFTRSRLREVSEAFEHYSKAIDREFLLLRQGEIQEAKEWDEAQVDPSFSRLSDALRETAKHFDASALSALAKLRLWTSLLLVGAGTLIAVVAHQFYNRYRMAELAAAEERALRQANAELEKRVLERTAELSALNEQIKVSARKAGMAEVASSVLHNVGNAINSVNVSATVLAETLVESPLKDLPAAAGLLQEHSHHLADFLTRDEQGKQFPSFLKILADQWSAEHAVLNRELAALTRHVHHVREIIKRQQSVSGISGLFEGVALQAAVEEALGLNAPALSAHSVQVRCEIPNDLLILADQSRLTQILVNLIANAVQALAEVPAENRRLTVEATCESLAMASLRVVDNGSGISPENLSKIFAYGFTTKRFGHGFGLHGSALGAKEMGGTLSVRSDGVGRGACFTLTLPLYEAGTCLKAA